MTLSDKALELAKIGSCEPEVYQAFIDNYSEEETTLEKVEESYLGKYNNDEDFARDQHEQTSSNIDETQGNWPYYCIDWEWASRELMYDCFEVDGYYFRSM